MSLLNVWVSPERALISVDTDGLTSDGEHVEMSKLLVLAHANTVLGFRGDRRFMHDLFATYYLAAAAVDFDAIVAALPEMLASVILAFRAPGIAPQPYQFAIVGWSAAEGRVCGRWYTGNTGEDGYDVDELGARVAPWHGAEAARLPDSEDSIRWLSERQAPWLREEGAAGGGRLLIAQVTRCEIIVRDEGPL